VGSNRGAEYWGRQSGLAGRPVGMKQFGLSFSHSSSGDFKSEGDTATAKALLGCP
jgi:hypothetical protein